MYFSHGVGMYILNVTDEIDYTDNFRILFFKRYHKETFLKPTNWKKIFLIFITYKKLR